MNKVLILDFGSQYTQLIARRIREQKIYCEIHPCTLPIEKIKDFKAQALILSGGPASVLQPGAPSISKEIFELSIPILGICYGMQLITQLCGGKIVASEHREYGSAEMQIKEAGFLLEGIGSPTKVWMSHGDSIQRLPDGFKILGRTKEKTIAAMAHPAKKIYGLQFHPEVHHTEHGVWILKNFLLDICKFKPDWTMAGFVKESIRKIKKEVGRKKVILGLSGGVDSSVAAVLIHRAIGNQLTCIFINNGVLRKNEASRVQEIFTKHTSIPFIYADASKEFLAALNGISDPEKKRKIIGKVFIDVFEEKAREIKNVSFLAQGTLYPDVIESVSFKGPSAVIKSHHNVGGLPKKMGLKLLEPFRELFKDEVRTIGRELGVPSEILNRHPFPGPGLAIRILGPVTESRLRLVREADHIILDEIKKADFYHKVWQAFAVLLPVKSVGVMGDERTYENVCAVRVVTSLDGMTADWVDLPHNLLTQISGRIINEVKGINRVVYDISSKPPATIEWE